MVVLSFELSMITDFSDSCNIFSKILHLFIIYFIDSSRGAISILTLNHVDILQGGTVETFFWRSLTDDFLYCCSAEVEA